MSSSSPSDRLCPACGTPSQLTGEDSLCPGCLLSAALERGYLPDEDQPPELEECGGYRLEKIIGRGAYGIVFLARRPGSLIPYALKLLASAQLAGPDEIRRFRFEAEAVFQINHRHIVRVVDIGEHDGAPYFVMDLAEGGNLAEQSDLARDPKAAEQLIEDRVRLIVKVARAVHFAHERGILHRDLKPANILLDRHGEPLVSDFGLARHLHTPSGVTMTGAALGTPSYMSPEQASGSGVTTATDQFSLGVILYQLLTGRTPFEGESAIEILRKTTTEDAPDPRSFAPWLDRDLATICMTALRREATRRYPAVALFADDLERWLRGEPVLARPLSVFEKASKWSRRHPVSATFGITGTIAGIVLLTLLLTGSVLLRKERNHALRQEAIAKESALKASESERAAITARDEFQLNSYAADIYLAFRAKTDGHLGQARQMLARQKPSSDMADQRGFEWYALDRLCRGDDIRSYHDLSAPVLAVAFDPTGKTIAYAGRDGRLILRAWESGSLIMELSMPEKPGVISRIAWSPDSKLIVTAGPGSDVRLWSIPDGTLKGRIPVTTAKDVGFSADGNQLFVFRSLPENDASHDLRFYQTKDLVLRRVIDGLLEPHAVSADGRLAAVMPKAGNRIDLYDTAKSEPLRAIDHGFQVKQLAFSKDAATLFGAEQSGILIACWRTSDGQRTGSVFPIAGKYERFIPSPDAKRLAATNAGQMVSFQALEGDSPAGLLRGHEDLIHDLAYSPDGKLLASAGNDHSCRIWQATPMQPPALGPAEFDDAPSTLPDSSLGPVVSPSSGSWIASCSDDNAITIHDRSNKNVIAVLRGHQGKIRALVISPDGRTLASCADDATLRLWHVATWRELGILHQQELLHHLAFSKSGDVLRGVTASGQTRDFGGKGR